MPPAHLGYQEVLMVADTPAGEVDQISDAFWLVRMGQNRCSRDHSANAAEKEFLIPLPFWMEQFSGMRSHVRRRRRRPISQRWSPVMGSGQYALDVAE